MVVEGEQWELEASSTSPHLVDVTEVAPERHYGVGSALESAGVGEVRHLDGSYGRPDTVGIDRSTVGHLLVGCNASS